MMISASWAQRGDWKALYEKGEAAHNAGNHKTALEYLNQSVKENPSFPDAYFTRAAIREQLKDLQGANTDYNIYL